MEQPIESIFQIGNSIILHICDYETTGAIWEIGTTEDMDLEDRKLVMFSNGIYFIAGSILMLAEIVMGGFISIITNPSVRTLTPLLLIGLAIFSH